MRTSTDTTVLLTDEAMRVTRAVAPERVQNCDFRAIRTFDKSSLAPLAAANQVFAKSATQVLSKRLNLKCEVSVQSFDATDGRPCLEKSSDASYFITLHLAPLKEIALLQIDPTLIFPLIDALLGGSGKPSEALREITEIEDHIVRDVVRVMCLELQNGWSAYNIEVLPGNRQSLGELRATAFFMERVLASSFSIELPEVKGGIRLLLPICSLTAFVHASPELSSAESLSPRSAISRKLAEQIADFNFGVDLTLPGARVQAADLLNLSLGKIVRLGVPLQTMAVVGIGGRGTFDAVPVRSSSRRAAQIIERRSGSPKRMETT
jgi:flagellar motor switch protein FliM